MLLVWHGAEFVVHGLLDRADLVDIDPELRSVSRCYTFLWGPWFVAGGATFVIAARAHLDNVTDRRAARTAGTVGGVGALVLSAPLPWESAERRSRPQG
ncbi:hypothetical protein ACIRL2_39300 [Embleya sp. NPDC127516]|uniref:hypothetical protein n=1 Tax=Embleya sp. NPDC127516 TaxID=3363990 RepID=UPI003805B177